MSCVKIKTDRTPQNSLVIFSLVSRFFSLLQLIGILSSMISSCCRRCRRVLSHLGIFIFTIIEARLEASSILSLISFRFFRSVLGLGQMLTSRFFFRSFRRLRRKTMTSFAFQLFSRDIFGLRQRS